MAPTPPRQPSPPSAAGLARGLLFVHLLLSPLVFTTLTLELFEYPKVAVLRLTALGLAGLGLAALAGLVTRRAYDRRRLDGCYSFFTFCREPVTLGVLLFTASAALSTVYSLSPRTSLDGAHESFAGLATVAAYAVLFLATRAACRNAADGWRLLAGVVVAAALAAVYALAQAARLDPLRWTNESVVVGYARPVSTLGHANHLATYLTMALPFLGIGAARAARSGRRTLALSLAGVGLLALAGIAVTLSRAGWVALGCVAPLVCAGLWYCGRRRAALAGAGLLAVAVVVGVGAFAAAGADFRSALMQRVRNFGDDTGRSVLWRVAWAMARERPLTGVGLDAFPLAFGQYRPAAFWRLEWNVTPTKVHNDPMHVLATQGFPGAAAGLAVLAGLVVAFRRAWRRTDDDGRLLAVAVGCAVVGFLVTGLFGFTVAATGTLFVTCAGILARLGESKSQIPNSKSQIPNFRIGIWDLGFGTSVIAAAWFGVIQPLRADICASSAARLRASDPCLALSFNESAVVLDPGRAALWAELAETARLAVPHGTNPGARQHYAWRVKQATAEAVRLEPAAARRHARRGELLLELAGDGLADPAAPLPALQAALERDLHNPCILAGAARAAWACGRVGLAHEYLRRGLAIDPDQADLYATLGSFAAAEGRFEEAEAKLAASFQHNWHGYEDGHLQALTLWCYCLTRLQRLDRVELLLRFVVARRPDWPGPHLALGQVLALQGRPEAADEFRRVIALAPGHPFADEARRYLKK